MEEESFYKSSTPLKMSRKLGTYTLDFFILFICCILLFGLGDLIGNSTGYVNNTKEELQTKQNELYSLVIESKLDEMSLESGNLKGASTLSIEYVYCSTLAALKNNGVEDISETTYTNYYQIEPAIDNAYYFFTVFKKDKQSSFKDDDEDKSNYGVSYYKSLLVSKTSSSYFEDGDYPYLTLVSAKKVDSYLRDDNYTSGKEIYDSLLAGYQEILLSSQEEYKSYYIPYIEVNEEFNKLSNNIYKVKMIELGLSYILSVFICFFIIPLCFKNGKTVSYRFMQIGVNRTDGFKVKWNNLLIKTLVNLVEYACLIPLTSLVVYSSQAISLFDYSISIGFNFLIVVLISLLFMLFAFIFCFINRKTKQSISEFFSRMVVKDGREFKVTESAFDSKGSSLKDGK